jgi:hypothetical protein
MTMFWVLLGLGLGWATLSAVVSVWLWRNPRFSNETVSDALAWAFLSPCFVAAVVSAHIVFVKTTWAELGAIGIAAIAFSVVFVMLAYPYIWAVKRIPKNR